MSILLLVSLFANTASGQALGDAAPPVGADTIEQDEVVYRTFDEGASSVPVFSGSGAGIGTGDDPDRAALEVSIDPAMSGGYAGIVLEAPGGMVDASASSYLMFDVRTKGIQQDNLPLTLSINLQEDADGNPATDGIDDEYQMLYALSADEPYELVQIPLSAFVDDDSAFPGSDDGFDFSRLRTVVIVVEPLSGPEFSFGLDEIRFTDSGNGPLAQDDAATTAPGQPVAIDVLANDVVGVGSFLTRSVFSNTLSPVGGTVSSDPQNGLLTFTPAPGFTGQSIFTYTVQNSENQASNAAMVTVTVDEAAFSCMNVADVPQSECQALVDLYNSTDGDNWLQNGGWLGGAEVGAWFGVTVEGGHVTKIRLDVNELTGTLPASIGDLEVLQWLFVPRNNLSGPIPQSIGTLDDLELLALNRNRFTGGFPEFVTGLTALSTLDLEANNLTGPIPSSISNLQNLEFTNLGTNDWTGSIPASVGTMTNLEALLLYNNGLEGPLPAELTGMTSLNWFEFIGTGICEPAENAALQAWLGGIDQLTTSGLTCDPVFDCGAVTDVPAAQCEALVDLYVSTSGDNWVDNTGWLSAMDAGSWFGVAVDGGGVTALDLRENNLSGVIPPSLEDLSQLVDLFLLSNQLTGDIPSELGNLPQLSRISFFENQLTGEIPSELGNLSTLTRLFVPRNQLTGEIPPELGQLTQLTGLGLYGNQLTGGIPPELGNLDQLEFLGLYENELSGSIPEELASLSQLTALHLQLNQLSGSIPPELGSLSQLVTLDLGRNLLTGSIPEELGNLTQLTTLALNELAFDPQPLPVSFASLVNLNVLDLGLANLTGSIPSWIGTLSNLRFLGFFGNDLSGPLPETLGNLSNLQVFGVGQNQLSGSVPASLGDLPLLYLYLNDNNFSGPLPAQFGGLIDLFAQGNRFTFEDLLPVVSGAEASKRTRAAERSFTAFSDQELASAAGQSVGSTSIPDRFIYAPQQTYGNLRSRTFTTDEFFSISSPVPGADAYQWYRDGEPVSDATGSTYFEEQTTTELAGEYTVEATNPDLPDLTIATAPITISIEAITNTAPVAVDDEVTTVVQTDAVIDVLGNDTDDMESLDPSSVTITDDPLNGTAEVLPDGQITYTPAESFVGNDQFRYTVADDDGLVSNEARVSITVDLNVAVDSEADVPDQFTLDGSYPNPFNPTTSIRYAVPSAGDVDVTVFDVTGRKIQRLVSGPVAAGWHEVSFSAGALSSGLYLYVVRFDGQQKTGYMSLLK